MKILLVAATRTEIDPLLPKVDLIKSPSENILSCSINDNSLDILLTGIGVLQTTFFLTKELSSRSYDFVINAGIAGSYNPGLSIGSVVHITEEVMGDTGIEESGQLNTFFEKGLMDKDDYPYRDGILVNPSFPDLKVLESLPVVRGMTTGILHTDPEIIQMLKEKFRVDIESMEGASVFYSCLMGNVPFIEVRSISNIVGETDRKKWNIPLAVENLNEVVLKMFNELE